MPSKSVLITGGCGVVGTVLRRGLGSKYEMTCLDLTKSGPGCVAGDITKPAEVEPLFRGKDVVVHLAGVASLDAPWDAVHEVNIVGTYNVFEAARKAGVKRVVFASSNHVTGLYEKDRPISDIVRGDYSRVDPKQIARVSHLSPPRPDTFYGISKLFGEGLGQYYSFTHGISVICLRIGTVRAEDNPDVGVVRFFATWLTHPDLLQLVEKSIEARDVKFDVFYGVSNNKWRFWDISHAGDVVGYEPTGDAERSRP